MLRTFRINFKKNWVCQPSKWNLFWENLKKDMEDLEAEMDAASFSFSNIHSEYEELVEKTGKFKRIKHPGL